MITFRDGTQFRPSKAELFKTLVFLKGQFDPEMFSLFFENDGQKRDWMLDYLSLPSAYMSELSFGLSRPDLFVLSTNADRLSFAQCAQYLLYYFRLAYSQGGGENFIKLWTDGSTSRVIARMLQRFDDCPEFDLEKYK